MGDMAAVIVPKSDQINADDLIAGPKTYTIEAVDVRPGTEQPVNIHLVGEPRAWRPCKSMSRVLVAAWGPDSARYKGKSLTLYRDPKVKWGGLEIGGIRVSHMSGIEREMLLQLTATKGKRAPHIVKPLADQPAQQSAAEEYTIDQARDDIATAHTLGELSTVWRQKRMAPHRTELQADLDARKAALDTPADDPFATTE